MSFHKREKGMSASGREKKGTVVYRDGRLFISKALERRLFFRLTLFVLAYGVWVKIRPLLADVLPALGQICQPW